LKLEFFMLSELKSISAATTKAKALSAIWTFPSIIFSALVIGWAAEVAQILVSQDQIVALTDIRGIAV